MTTATTIDNSYSTITNQGIGLPATPLDLEAGDSTPNKAMDPELIYDLHFQDYVEFLCNLGYNNTQMSTVIRKSHWSCNNNPTELNYPSFIANFPSTTSFPVVKNFSRVVTNIGDENSVYKAVLEAPTGIRIKTVPDTLAFTARASSKDSY
ncbi:hypothetical protein GIB67_016601 [Kingdonia uniflora]|uniref:Subtilisin-like protease fibronectin type-III domain-containing protein n=1 Tax=Kingdonia uniflora TaxID=39325 RepID=A0A7J7MZ18_9MAGN|nr:hypothetical protein GIB67_016601 [Kingdonia uniflora]